jgi:cytochrome P450
MPDQPSARKDDLTVVEEIRFDPFSAAMHRDPYPTYARLREESPVHYSEEHNFWFISRYADVTAVLRDWRHFSSAFGVDIDDTGSHFGEGNFLEEDPPLHDVHRNVIRKEFTPAQLRQQLEATIRTEAGRLLDEIEGHNSVDFARDFAWKLAITVASALLGLRPGDRDELRDLAFVFAEREAGLARVPDKAIVGADRLREYLAEMLRERRRAPGNDVLSLIANAELAEGPIGPAALGLTFILYDAAVETSASSITNGLWLLSRHPDQRRWLATHPEHIGAAFEEIVRYESPVQSTKRRVLADVVVGGVEIPAGASVVLLLGAANRDERRFPGAEAFDVRREAQRNLAFGEGIHHCIGAPVARLEGPLALAEVLRRDPEYVLEGAPVRLSNHIVRGFTSMPATVTRAR